VPSLYIRNARYYCQLWIDRGDGRKSARRFPPFNSDSLPARTLNEAKEALEIKRNDRREDGLPALGRKPSFLDFSETYLNKAKVQRKRPGRLQNEQQAIARWRSHLGHVRIDKIATPMVATFVDKRLKGGFFGKRKLEAVSERTANLDVIVLRNVPNTAIDDGYLRDLPRIKLLEEPPAPKRRLLTPGEFDLLIRAAKMHCKTNGTQLADYLRFLAFSGVRAQQALRIKWTDVNFQRERITIGADRLSKNRESRTVEFNPKLRAHLIHMKGNRAPDCSWLFPSPRRGTRHEHARSFCESLKIARKATDQEWVGFHDLRHYFCSSKWKDQCSDLRTERRLRTRVCSGGCHTRMFRETNFHQRPIKANSGYTRQTYTRLHSRKASENFSNHRLDGERGKAVDFFRTCLEAIAKPARLAG
jgi:integrase